MSRIINISSGCMVEINCAEKKSFIHYLSGVFTSKGGETLHAMAVVGYGNLRGVDMWIVRNSWSVKWGNKVSILLLNIDCSRLLFHLHSFPFQGLHFYETRFEHVRHRQHGHLSDDLTETHCRTIPSY